MPLIGLLTSGVSSLKSFSSGMDVIGDNIANVNTTAYKGSRAQYSNAFADVLQRSAASPGDGNGSDVVSMQVGQGVRVSSIMQDFAQGGLSTTGVPTDFGISGEGFFRVRDVTSGQDYVTRSGDFRIDDQGYLVTDQGMRVQGLFDGSATIEATVVNGRLTYSITASTPATTVGDLSLTTGANIADGTLVNNTGGEFSDEDIEANAPKIVGFGVNRGGEIMIQLSNGQSFSRGKILLQSFQDPRALVREAGNLYSGLETANPIGGLNLSEANNSPGQGGNGQIEQGTLELSNVDLTEQFANLINTQRSFQAGSRIITTADQVLEEIVNLKR